MPYRDSTGRAALGDGLLADVGPTQVCEPPVPHDQEPRQNHEMLHGVQTKSRSSKVTIIH